MVGSRLLACLLSLLVISGAGWGWHLGRVADASVNRTDAIPTEGNDGGGEAMNLLLVGSDSRASASEDQLDALNTGYTAGSNTDTMILAHVPADGSKASLVSLPRDSYVEIPGYGWDKLNAAYAYGYQQEAPESATDAEKRSAGAQLLIKTLSNLTGLSIDHYIEVDLLGFFELTNVIGGVEVNLCAPAQDDYSGIDLAAGVQTISGEQALAFVRQRHGLPRGDFDRIIRQQAFLAGLMRKVLSENLLLDLRTQQVLVDSMASSLTVDQSLDIFELAAQMQSVTADSIHFQTIPYIGDDEDESGRYILRLEDEERLHAFFADLSAQRGAGPPAPAEATTEPEPIAPSEISVEVLNGSGESGLATKTATALELVGYGVTSTGNAASAEHATTEIRHAPGDEAAARTLAASVGGAMITPAAEVHAGTVQLVLGSDFHGVSEPVTAAPTIEGKDPRTAANNGCIS